MNSGSIIAWSGYVLLVLILIVSVLFYARRRNLVDHPEARRNHARPTPRGGGAGISLALLFWLFASAVTGNGFSLVVSGWIAAGLVSVAGIGWWDDHIPLSARMRLLVHLLAGLCVAIGMREEGASLQWQAVALIAVPLGVNLWNFMDGINGMVTIQALVAGLFFSVVAIGGPVAGFAMAVWLGCAVFLPFNFPVARIFLGDVGSGSLGYCVAVLWLFTGSTGGFISASVLALVLLPVLVDSLFTIGWRLFKGQNLLKPHSEHLYQRAVRSGWSHFSISCLYGSLAMALGAGAVLCSWLHEVPKITVASIFLVTCIALWLVVFFRLGSSYNKE